MKKILLISANRHKEPYPVYPLGVTYLKSYLDRHLQGFETIILDCNMFDNKQLAELIKQQSPNYIGISLRNIDGCNSLDRSSFVDDYKQIIDIVRSVSTSPLIIGGTAFSIYPKTLFDELKPNFGIMGEGEESLNRLITALENGEETSTIEGVVSYKDGKFICNKHSAYLKSLDAQFDPNLINYYWKDSGMLNIQTKRGCPYNCIYCSYPLIDGRKVRTLDPEMIIENIKKLKTDEGVNYMFFTDSVFNIHNSYNVELAEKLIKSEVKIRWGAYFAPNNMTNDMWTLFKASGLTHVEFGTESFSDQQLANYGKQFTVSDVLKQSELCLNNNIYYAHYLILGGYKEDAKSIKETIENSKKMSYSVYFPYFGMRIYPGTKLQTIAINEGLITKENDLLAPTYYIAKDFDIEKIKSEARATEKAWVFPDDPIDEMMDVFRKKKNKKGLLWEYLRKP